VGDHQTGKDHLHQRLAAEETGIDIDRLP